MGENPLPNNPGAAQEVKAPRRNWIVLIGTTTFVVLVGAGVALLIWHQTQHGQDPLDGELSVTLIKVTKGKQETFQLEEPSALPIREGDRMHLTIRCNQPAHMYLLWLNSRGNVVPLYPWNMDNIEVKDADGPPPACSPTTVVFNPITIGHSWKLDKGSGLETVLLLARRTPLAAEVKFQTLLGDIPPAKLSDPGEVAILGLDRGSPSLSTLKAIKRGSVDEARERDRVLAAQLDKLRDHFEMIRVVRFAHADK